MGQTIRSNGGFNPYLMETDQFVAPTSLLLSRFKLVAYH